MIQEQSGCPVITPTPTPRGVDASPLERFTTIFPWMRSLSLADQEACANDLASAASPELLVAEPRSWKKTARAVAAGYRDVELEWLD